MDIKKTLFLAGVGLAVVFLVSIFQITPGYTDADYYFTTGLRIANGEALTVPYIWNYLADFPNVTHPSHAYWMPLVSFISALGVFLFGGNHFTAAKIPFTVIAAAIPPLTAHLSYQISNNKKAAMAAGLLACFPIFYLSYLPVTDSFALYMVLGACYFILIQKSNYWEIAPLLLGVVAGTMHLTRPEGFIWLFLGMVALLFERLRWKNVLLVLVGYGVIFGPWMIRNLTVFGSPFGPGGQRALWITNYNQLFGYPPETVTFANWWKRGVQEIINERWWAAGFTLQTMYAVQGQIILAPLVIWGGIKMWKQRPVKIGAAALLIIWWTMTVIFPYQGARGGYFHGGAALQPLIWALAAIGFYSFVKWGEQNRSWRFEHAWRVLGSGLLTLIIVLAMWVTWKRVIGGNLRNPTWNSVYYQYETAHNILQKLGSCDDDVIMINNPPGYYAVSGQRSVVIPDGGVETLLAAANEYGVDYLVLDHNVPLDLKPLYRSPRNEAELNYLQSTQGMHFFKIENTPPQ